MTETRTLKDYRPQHDLTCPVGSVKPECPTCRGLLDPVRQGRNSMLNEYQFDAVKAGDYYCTVCKGGEAESSTHKYWWARELEKHPCSCGLDALLAQPPAQGGWQTMETAPKDGTWVLLVGHGWHHPSPGCWSSYSDTWVDHDDEMFDVSHWMPLPALPTQDKET